MSRHVGQQLRPWCAWPTRLETDGKLGRVYSYYNYRRKRRAYVHVLSAHAGRINEQLALRRAEVLRHTVPLAHLATCWYTKGEVDSVRRALGEETHSNGRIY